MQLFFPNRNDRLPFSLSQWKGETSKKLQFEHTCSMFDHVQIEQRAGQSWPEMPALLHSLDLSLTSWNILTHVYIHSGKHTLLTLMRS